MGRSISYSFYYVKRNEQLGLYVTRVLETPIQWPWSLSHIVTYSSLTRYLVDISLLSCSSFPLELLWTCYYPPTTYALCLHSIRAWLAFLSQSSFTHPPFSPCLCEGHSSPCTNALRTLFPILYISLPTLRALQTITPHSLLKTTTTT